MNNKALEELQQVDLASVDVPSLVRLVSSAFDQVHLIGAVTHSPMIFCRARRGHSPFHHRDQISYNRNSSEAGRCNFEGQSLLYAASSVLPLPVELETKPGEVLTVGYWRSTRKLLILPFGFSEEVRGKLGTKLRAHIKDELPNIDQESALRAECYKYLMDVFTRLISENEHHHYKLTSAIAEILLGDVTEGWAQQFYHGDSFNPNCFDGIKYPSIATFGNHHNYAIRPKTIDASVELFRAETFQVEAVEDGLDVLVPLRTGFPTSDGTILWTNRFETRYEVQLANGSVSVSHDDGGFRVTNSSGEDSLGF